VTAAGQSSRGRSPAVRLAMVVLVVGGLTLLLRAVPLLDARVEELWGRLNALHEEAIAAQDRPGEWGSFAENASARLKDIADDARMSHARRIGPWRWIAGEDRREEAALREVQRLAESDLPALIASGPKGHALREKNVAQALARLDDHLAGASPYLPPTRPIENQDGMDRTTGVKQSWPAWVVAIVVVDAVGLVALAVWWSRRSNKSKP
jgi:hypothetical protein